MSTAWEVSLRPANLAIFCITFIVLAALLAFVLATRQVANTTGQTIAAAREMLDALFGPGKAKFTLSEHVVSITPVSEIALASQTIRITDTFSRSWMGSECVVVSEQDFVIKWGYDSKDVFTIMGDVAGSTIPEPRILSVEPLSGAPRPLFEANGIWNRLTPDDIRGISNRMRDKARFDRQAGDFQRTLRDIIDGQLNVLRRQMQPPAQEP